MYTIIKKEKRYLSDMGNMRSHFLFSFADYYDPQNTSFGKIRVWNDDVLDGQSGFGMHPHKYYEIMTVMLDGQITHKDNLGNHLQIRANEIQVTDTARGIFHSEINQTQDPLHLYQIWFAPDSMSETPRYFTRSYEETDYQNTLFCLASGLGDETPYRLTSKVRVLRGKFLSSQEITLGDEPYTMVYVTSGSLKYQGNILEAGDQLRIQDETQVKLFLQENTEILVIQTQ